MRTLYNSYNGLLGGRVVVSPIPWSPSDEASLIDWFDASDDSTITTAGSTVTEWRSKTASGNILSASTNFPTHDDVLNHVNIGSVSSNRQLSDTAISDGAITQANISLYVVSALSGDGYVFNIDTAGAGVGLCLRRFSSFFRAYFDPTGTTGSIGTSSASYVGNTNAILGAISNGAGASTLAVSFNGTLSAFSGTTTRFTATRYLINRSLVSFLQDTSEIIVMADASSTVYRKIEGYLAWKYGVTLPSGHPYELEAP